MRSMASMKVPRGLSSARPADMTGSRSSARCGTDSGDVLSRAEQDAVSTRSTYTGRQHEQVSSGCGAVSLEVIYLRPTRRVLVSSSAPSGTHVAPFSERSPFCRIRAASPPLPFVLEFTGTIGTHRHYVWHHQHGVESPVLALFFFSIGTTGTHWHRDAFFPQVRGGLFALFVEAQCRTVPRVPRNSRTRS